MNLTAENAEAAEGSLVIAYRLSAIVPTAEVAV